MWDEQSCSIVCHYLIGDYLPQPLPTIKSSCLILIGQKRWQNHCAFSIASCIFGSKAAEIVFHSVIRAKLWQAFHALNWFNYVDVFLLDFLIHNVQTNIVLFQPEPNSFAYLVFAELSTSSSPWSMEAHDMCTPLSFNFINNLSVFQ